MEVTNKNPVYIEIIKGLIVALFIYTAATKLLDFHIYSLKMLRQPLPRNLTPVITYLVPILEIVASVLLLFRSSQLFGFLIASVMMIAFTIYVDAILNHAFGTIPCSCGGAIESLSWNQHLILNSVFSILSMIGLIYSAKVWRAMRSGERAEFKIQ